MSDRDIQPGKTRRGTKFGPGSPPPKARSIHRSDSESSDSSEGSVQTPTPPTVTTTTSTTPAPAPASSHPTMATELAPTGGAGKNGYTVPEEAIYDQMISLGASVRIAQIMVEVQSIKSQGDVENITKESLETMLDSIRQGTKHTKTSGNVPFGTDATNVPVKFDQNFQIFLSYLIYRKHTDGVFAKSAADLNNDWKIWHDEINADDNDPVAPTLKSKEWHTNLEKIRTYFNNLRSKGTKLPLGYVIRSDEAPSNARSRDFTSYDEELIAKARIKVAGTDTSTAWFKADNQVVFKKLQELLADHTQALTYIKKHEAKKDGRAALKELEDSYIGVAYATNLFTEAENKLRNLTYHGEQRRFNFDKYVEISTKQHAILDDLEARGLYKGMDQQTKVHHFVSGINFTPLNSCVTQILSTPTLMNDFKAAKDLCKNFLASSSAIGKSNKEKSVTITSLSGKRLNESDADMSVKLRYYKGDEYKKLTDAQKLGLKIKRKRKKDEKSGGSGGGGGKRMKLSDADIKAVASQVAALNVDDGGNSQDDKENTDEKPSNRTNSALKRKDGKK